MEKIIRLDWETGLILPSAVRHHRVFFLFHHIGGGAGKATLDCAHRTRAFLGRAFCEQGGHLAAPCLRCCLE